MAEQGSDKRDAGKLRYRTVFTEDAVSSDALEAAERLFARWVARGLAARTREALDPVPVSASGAGRADADGGAPAPSASRTGRTERTHYT